MRRREFIALVGATVAWPVTAHGQQSERMRRVAVLLAAYTETDRAGQARIKAFLSALQGLGWTEERNIRFDLRWGAGNLESAKTLAAELVRSAPDAIIVAGDPALAELHQLATRHSYRIHPSLRSGR